MAIKRWVRLLVAATLLGGVLAAVLPFVTQAGASTYTWSKLSPATSPTARSGAPMAYDPATGQLVLFGGCPYTLEDDALGDTWTWNGSTWTRLSPDTSPPALCEPSMAYDPATGNVVLFGGLTLTGAASSETWTWNGSTWTEVSTGTSPPGRFGASMAYDSATGSMVLFGGGDNTPNTPILDDTWTWNGATWTKHLVATSPSARYYASIANDPATGNVILFGGTAPSTLFSDTWTWNGATWTKHVLATSPSPRGAASLAYDTAIGELVLFGGGVASGASSETWTWNGSTWTKLSPVTSPTARSNASMAYDPATGQLVLFGGEPHVYPPGVLKDTWTLNVSSMICSGIPPLTLTPPAQTPLPPATTGVLYSAINFWTVSCGPVIWSETGALDGLAFDVSGTHASLVGTPVASGCFTFTVTVETVALRSTVTQKYGFCVAPPSLTPMQSFRLTVEPGVLTLTCGTHDSPTPATDQNCASISLGNIRLDEQWQVKAATGHELIVSTARGGPTDDWTLNAAMVPTPVRYTGNPHCTSLADFCNATTTSSTAQEHNPNSQITSNFFSVHETICKAQTTSSGPTQAYYNPNPNPTAGPGGAFGIYTPVNRTATNTVVTLCTAGTGYSGGEFLIDPGTYTLEIPPTIYSGTYWGTVQYTLVASS